MIAADIRGEVIDVLSFLAGRKTCSEIMFGNDKLPVQSVEERMADMGRCRVAHDAAVLKARGLLDRLGSAS